MINWENEFGGAITVCDRLGIIVYMNEYSKKQFAKYGGEKLIGTSLIDCHPESARPLLLEMLKTPMNNAYLVEKHGVKKQVLQTPWMENGVFKGVVELSFIIPNEMPVHLRG